ncbi:MAG: DEAD/DEAH box helicase [Bacteroidales bacterium]
MINKPETSFGETKFVFAITKHEVLGVLIEPFAVKINAKGFFSYEFSRITKNTYYDHFSEITSIQENALQIIDEYSDENLLKRFNRNKVKIKDFIKGLNKEFINEHVRPYIDRRHYELVKLLAENDIPLFYKGGVNDRIKEEEIVVYKEMADVLFHFKRTSEHTSYKLSVFHSDRKVDLFEKEVMILSLKPCLLLLDSNVYIFDEKWDGRKLLPFINKESVIIPKSSEKIYFEKFVLNAVKNHKVEAEGFKIEYYNDDIKPLLKIENNLFGECVAGLYFNYGGLVTYAYNDKINNATKLIAVNDDYTFLKVPRDIDFEEKYASILKSFGLRHKNDLHFDVINENGQDEGTALGCHRIIDWLSEKQDLLKKQGFVVEQNFSKSQYLIVKPELEVEYEEKPDWFDLKITVKFGKYNVPFVKLKNNILKGEREYILPDGEIVLIPKEWFSQFKDIFKFSTKHGENINIKRHHYTLLSHFDIGKEFSINTSSIKPIQSLIPPKGLNAVLRKYQLEGYNWLYFLMQNRFGGVLADDMGLGKTLQVIALLSKIYHDSESEDIDAPLIKNDDDNSEAYQLDIFSKGTQAADKKAPTLVVMPLSLVHNWAKEIERFAPFLRVHQHVGTNRSGSASVFKAYDVVLTTYGTVRNDVEFLKNFNFNYLILDESQIIKNAGSKIFQAVKSLKAYHRLVLTGTPIENSLTDLWSQFSFLNPGMLGSLSFFKDEYVTPIEKSKDVIKRDKLQRLINPFVLRRTKDEVEKELPELTEMVHYCEMTKEQHEIYEEKKSEIRNYILENISKTGINKSRFLILSSLMRLRLIANHPALAEPDYNWSSGKYTEVVRSIEKLITEGHKVLIFSQFVKHLNLFKKYLESNNIAFNFLTGNTAEKDRQILIDDFQNKADKNLFLISLKAGGVGLNLTGADYVFLLDPWWNPAVENQAINRAHRIGQDKKVFVYKFITRNSIEEKITMLQQKKSKLAGMVINSNNPISDINFEQIESLL